METILEASQEITNVLALPQFIADFGDSLLESVRSGNPPIYDGKSDATRNQVMEQLLRKPFGAQQETVQAVTKLLVDHNQPAAVINAEMGTGKTMMAIATAAVMHAEGFRRTLVISPPHLVYKWRREIKQTIPNAIVTILNGPDTLRKLLALRGMQANAETPEFFILGRVRMRMGFHWRPAFAIHRRQLIDDNGAKAGGFACCPRCGSFVTDEDDDPLLELAAQSFLDRERRACQSCGERLWMLVARGKASKSKRDLLLGSLTQIPTIGEKSAERLVTRFGEEMLAGMLEDNVFEFINLMNDEGELVFNDRQARRMERAMANMEFSFGQGGYQPTEFVKRYLPQGFFGLLVVDEGHEYKNEGSAQGQAMGVLARKCSKTILLTGTLMGGYADDLFHLLWRLNPQLMMEDGFGYNARRSLGPAQLAFMREHGVVKDIYKSTESGEAHRTAKGSKTTHRVAKAPGFGPKGIARFVLPITVFLKLKDIGGNVLPPYREFFTDIAMTTEQLDAYSRLESRLVSELRTALVRGDKSLLGVVLNTLLAWPECCFRDELVRHPHTRSQLAYQPAIFREEDVMPKEAMLLDRCKTERAKGRRVLAYTIYTGTRDTSARLKALLEREGFRVAVLRASVEAVKREDWLFEQVDRGVDVLITNPELVKTGLDLLDFPTIVFMQSGFNAYTLQQAARRSWRIGQRQDVDVHYLGYAGSAQMQCLRLMAKKIAVSQSTSGDMPDCGLDILNQDGDSIEVALAKQLV
ncbi:MAG: DEAD/DEAH box helicase family protein [Pseudomonadota bacterium]